jgi:hypothetical protein
MPGWVQALGVGSSGMSLWKTRGEPRTTPWVLADLHRLPLGIPAGVFGETIGTRTTSRYSAHSSDERRPAPAEVRSDDGREDGSISLLAR